MKAGALSGFNISLNTLDPFSMRFSQTKRLSILHIFPLMYPSFGDRESSIVPVMAFFWYPITNDYKVVVLQYSEDIDYTLGMVHTLGTDYWKDLGTDLDAEILILNRTTCCTYLNGFYYFLGSHARVISFDMGTDALQVIPQPNEIQLPMGQWSDQNLHLAVYQDRIALFKLGYQDYHLNVWLLEEGSWIKHLSVGPLTGMVYPVGCWNNEEFLLHSETYMNCCYVNLLL
uniref:F-box associated beta-propeller type 3 domain-containing protein n=1 Tax=Rhizophora mucronata TaxID=61149 RepID=A0A2P2MWH3_RHIMU